MVDQPKLRKNFLDYMFNYLLLPYDLNKKPTPTAPPTTTQQSSTADTATTTANTTNPASETPACLNEKIFKHFKNDLSNESEDEIEEVIIILY